MLISNFLGNDFFKSSNALSTPGMTSSVFNMRPHVSHVSFSPARTAATSHSNTVRHFGQVISMVITTFAVRKNTKEERGILSKEFITCRPLHPMLTDVGAHVLLDSIRALPTFKIFSLRVNGICIYRKVPVFRFSMIPGFKAASMLKYI